MSSKLFFLTGRVALVTGGNRGLGRAMALGLRDAGATVVVSGRDETMNRAMAAELGDPSAVLMLDVRDEAAVAAGVDAVQERFGHLDVLVNNAGNAVVGSVLDMALDDWDAVIRTHLTGAFLCSKHAARTMVDRGEGGKIVNIGSMYSVYGAAGIAGYGTAKTGVLGLTRALAVELAGHGIQVNAILPGRFETDLTRGLSESEWGRVIRRKTPAGRWGEPADLVGAAVFLASAASNFVTGAAVPVDGGYAVSDRLLAEEKEEES